MLEAMAMGRPVITTDVPGCRETVVDGVNGLLVPPQDAAALRDAMMVLAGDGPMRERMGEKSFERARDVFDVDRVNDQIIEVVQELI